MQVQPGQIKPRIPRPLTDDEKERLSDLRSQAFREYADGIAQLLAKFGKTYSRCSSA